MARKGGAPENMITLDKRPDEEKKRICSMGGKASGVAKRRIKSLKEAAKAIGSEIILDPTTGDDVTLNYAIVMQLYNRALSGDTKAVKFLALLAGELVEKHQVEAPDTFTITIGGQPINQRPIIVEDIQEDPE